MSAEIENQSPPPPRVRILEDTVVNQIAAGEVVERPASVVKELVENALDAQATEISVVLSNGGRSSIEIIDNGRGMSREDALLAIERFGTSKIRSVGDLEEISSLGFRGEALPSIASVSKFRLQTKSSGASGVDISIRGGRLHDVLERDLPQGTRVEVKSLFFNVPARKKFLRTAATEIGHIRNLLADFAAAYPEHRFTLVSDGQELQCYPPSQSFAERVRELRVVQGKAIEVQHSELLPDSQSIHVRGVLSQAIEAVSSSARIRLLVNGRSVRDRLLLRAVREGYGSFLKPGKYPAGVLQISLPASTVDVNVHPQKTEVRFRDPQQVFSAISRAIAEAISSHSLLPRAEAPRRAFQAETSPQVQLNAPFRKPSAEPEFIVHAPQELGESQKSSFSEPHSDLISTPQTPPHSQPSLQAASALYSQAAPAEESGKHSASQEQDSLETARYLGQVMNLYLLFEASEELLILDMHAAHERVMFYKLKQQFLQGAILRQGLLVPETLELSEGEAERFDSVFDSLQKLGFESEVFGENTIIVRSVPAILGTVSASRLLREVLSLPEWADAKLPLERAIDACLARLACHRSVRSGQQLSAEEAYSLVDALKEAESASFCPHGRPVLLRYSESQLEALFGRSQF